MKCFLCLLLVNLLLLASLKKRSIHGKLNYFLEVGNGDGLDRDDLENKAAGDEFVLFWEAAALLAEKTFFYF